MKRSIRSRSERGIALMLCLFALLLLTTIGAGLMVMANTETSVNYNYRSSMQAYYASRAGLEEARERLRFGNSYSISPPIDIPSTSASGNLVYILNSTSSSDSVAPWDTTNRYFDDEFCNEPFTVGSGNAFGFSPLIGVPCSAGAPAGSHSEVDSIDPGFNTISSLGYKWVRITLKQNCTAFYGVDNSVGTSCFGGTNKTRLACADPNDILPAGDFTNGLPREKLIPASATTCESAGLRSVYLVTSFASSPRGARRMTQYELASSILPQLTAALTLEGLVPAAPSSSIISFPTANGLDGTDHATTGCTAGAAVAAIATTDTNSNTNLVAVLPNPLVNYTGVGTAPSVQTVGTASTPPLPLIYQTVGPLQNLVANITAAADQVVPSSTYPTTASITSLGTDTAPKITVINGDFNMGTSHGAGLLVVTGTLTSSGNPDFNGVILVIGKGEAKLSGGGNGAFNGGMLVANLYDGSGNLLPGASVPGTPTFTWTGGGTFNFNYSSCWINTVAARLPYKIIASREEMY